MSAGHVGIWKIKQKGSAFTQEDLNELEIEGYEIAHIVCEAWAYDSNNNPPTFSINWFAYGRYRGGIRTAAGG